jgi:lysophospholipase L1-like esterase
MPLGDSITYGNGYDIGGGYRQYLWTALPTVQPIGTSTLDPLPMLTGKDHHEGHPGFTAPQLAAGLPGWLLATGAPDAILLHAGTNDLYDSTVAADAVESIYDSLIGSNPSAILFVAAPIISVQNHPDFVPQYAAQVAAVLARLPKLPRAMAVPMPALLSSDYWDDFHPNSSGYSKIAAAWETALRAAGAQGTTMRAGLTGGSAGAVVGAGVAAASGAGGSSGAAGASGVAGATAASSGSAGAFAGPGATGGVAAGGAAGEGVAVASTGTAGSGDGSAAAIVRPGNAGLGGSSTVTSGLRVPPSPRVMFLGDSITYGVGSASGSGYRGFLLSHFPDFQPRGTLTNGPGDTPHEGHGGYASDRIAAGFPGWLAAVGPVDIVLLHCGTNDGDPPPDGAAIAITSIYATLMASNPNAILFVASPYIKPRSNRLDLMTQWQDKTAPLAARIPSLPRAIAVVMPDLAYGDYLDDLHPVDSGYQKMADAWDSALAAVGAE